MTDIAFVTTCKGRLHHLRETLPLILAERPAEIVVVDYACPDGAGDWVERHHPSVRVVRVTDDPGFCLPRARNIGARHSRSPWIVFIDADVKVRPGWVEWMKRHLQPGGFYRASMIEGRRDKETFGTIICPRPAFDRVEGDDEAFRGWGGEDDDLYDRLRLNQVEQRAYPLAFVEAIHHEDDERTRFHSNPDVNLHVLINALYRQIKIQLMFFSEKGRQPAIERRQALMAALKSKLEGWHPDGGGIDFGLEVDTPEAPLGSFSVRKKMNLRFTLTRRDLLAARQAADPPPGDLPPA